MKLNCPFPETVEYKSCTATIYQQQHREAERFEVRYYDVDGSMQRLTFPTYSSAKKFAETAVKEIAANREHCVTLRERAQEIRKSEALNRPQNKPKAGPASSTLPSTPPHHAQTKMPSTT